MLRILEKNSCRIKNRIRIRNQLKSRIRIRIRKKSFRIHNTGYVKEKLAKITLPNKRKPKYEPILTALTMCQNGRIFRTCLVVELITSYRKYY
jgi:hypothetical protein